MSFTTGRINIHLPKQRFRERSKLNEFLEQESVKFFVKDTVENCAPYQQYLKRYTTELSNDLVQEFRLKGVRLDPSDLSLKIFCALPKADLNSGYSAINDIAALDRDCGNSIIIPYSTYGFQSYLSESKLWISVSFKSPSLILIPRMIWPLILSFILIISTIVIFVILIRTILNQKKLAELKDDFITNMTHELKTPIATITAAIEGMQNFNALEDRGKTSRNLEISRKELKRLDVLVSKVLNMSTYEKGEINLIITKVNIAELIDEVIAAEKVKNTKAIEFTVAINQGLKEINVDRFHFRNCLANIIDNAIKYSNQPVKIEIDFTQNDHAVSGTIKDNGIGIPKSDITKVFDKFHRVAKGNVHDVKGTGLGLSYAKYIIEKHGGTLSVKSEIGNGSEFLIVIPKL